MKQYETKNNRKPWTNIFSMVRVELKSLVVLVVHRQSSAQLQANVPSLPWAESLKAEENEFLKVGVGCEIHWLTN